MIKKFALALLLIGTFTAQLFPGAQMNQSGSGGSTAGVTSITSGNGNASVSGTTGDVIFTVNVGGAGANYSFVDASGNKTSISSETVAGFIPNNILGYRVGNSSISYFVDATTIAFIDRSNTFSATQQILTNMNGAAVTLSRGLNFLGVVNPGNTNLSFGMYSNIVNTGTVDNTANAAHVGNIFRSSDTIGGGTDLFGQEGRVDARGIMPGLEYTGAIGFVSAVTTGPSNAIYYGNRTRVQIWANDANNVVASTGLVKANYMEAIVGGDPVQRFMIWQEGWNDKNYFAGPVGFRTSTVSANVFEIRDSVATDTFLPAMRVMSGNTTSFVFMQMGRQVADLTIGIAAGNSQFVTGTQSSWTFVRTESTDRGIVFGVGTDFPEFLLTVGSATATGNLSAYGVIRTTSGFDVGSSTIGASLVWNSIPYVGPASQSSGVKFLQNDGNGILSWAAATGSGGGGSLAFQNGTGGAWVTGISSVAVGSPLQFSQFASSGLITIVSTATMQVGNFTIWHPSGLQSLFTATGSSITFSTSTLFLQGLTANTTFVANNLVTTNALKVSGTRGTDRAFTDAGDGSLGTVQLFPSSTTLINGVTYYFSVNVTDRPAFKISVNGADMFTVGYSTVVFSTPTVFTQSVAISSLTMTHNEELDLPPGAWYPCVSSGGAGTTVYQSTVTGISSPYLTFGSTAGDVNYCTVWTPPGGFVGSTFTFINQAISTSPASTSGQNGAFAIAAVSQSSGTLWNSITYTSSATAINTINRLTELSVSSETTVTIGSYAPGQPVYLRYSRYKGSASDNFVGPIMTLGPRLRIKRRDHDY